MKPPCAERKLASAGLVGYGGDPEWTVDTAMGLVEAGAIAIRGNHDQAIGSRGDGEPPIFGHQHRS